MKIELELTGSFKKEFTKAPPKIKKQTTKRLRLFVKNPKARILNNHKLKGKYKNYSSINITGDWRIIYSTYKENNVTIAVLKAIGTHSKLYK